MPSHSIEDKLTYLSTECMIFRPLRTIAAGRGNPFAYRRENPHSCGFSRAALLRLQWRAAWGQLRLGRFL